MAIIDAIATGNYSNVATVFGGITPQPGDTIRLNAVSITLNIPITGITFDISNGNGRLFVTQTEITANGGTLTLSNCHFITNHTGTNTNVFQASFSSGKLVITGTITSLNGKFGIISLTGTAEVEVQNVTGTSTFGNSGILQIIGSNLSNKTTVTFCKGGTALASHAVAIGGTLTAYITTAEGGESSRSYGVILTGATGLVCYVEHSKPSQVSTLSSASPGMLIDNTCINTLCYITNAYGSDGGEGSALNRTAGVWTGSQDTSTQMGNGTRVYIKNLIFGLRGQTPISGTFFIWDTLDATCQYRLAPSGATKTLGNPASFGNAPSANNVRAGIVFNFGNDVGTCSVPAANQTAAGVPVDNTVGTAVLTTAGVASALTPITNQLDDIETTLGNIKDKTDTIGIVDLTPVTEQLDDIETTLGDIQAKTDTIEPVDLTPVTNQLDDIETTLGDIQAKTDTIEPVDLTPVTNQLDDIETTLGDIQAKTDTIGLVDLTPVTEQLDDIEDTLGDIQAKTETIEPPASGLHRLTITALDDGDLVGGVQLRVLDVAGTLRTTTTDGPTLIDLDPGDYSLRVSVPYGFATVADIAVDDLDAPRTITITLTRTAITPPAANNLCAVAVRVADASDTPLADAPVFAYLVTGPAVGDTLHTGPTYVETDANGLATLHLLRGQTYDLTATGFSSESTVRRVIPNASTANFGTLVAG